MRKFIVVSIITIGFAYIFWNLMMPCQMLDLVFSRSQCVEQHSDLRINYAAATSTDGSLLATGTLDGKVMVWQIDNSTLSQIATVIVAPVSEDSFSSMETILSVISPTEITTITFSPDNQYLAAASKNGNISLFQYVERKYQRIHSLEIASDFLAFSFDNSTLAIASEGQVNLWSVDDFSLNHTLEGDSFALSPTNNFLAVHDPEKGIVLWDFSNNSLIEEGIISPNRIGKGAFTLKLSPRNNELLLMGHNSESEYYLSLWNTSNLELITNFNIVSINESVSAWPGSIVFSEDGTELMIGSPFTYGPYAQKWQTSTGEKVMYFEAAKRKGLVLTSNVIPSVDHNTLFVTAAKSDVLQVWSLPEN